MFNTLISKLTNKPKPIVNVDFNMVLSPNLVKIAELLKLSGGFYPKGKSKLNPLELHALGVYNPVEDYIHVNEFAIEVNHYNLNEVVAHELVHATGHYSRLNRGDVGLLSKLAVETGSKNIKYLTTEAARKEETIAQYGAMLLLEVLNLSHPELRNTTANYITHKCMRRDGLPYPEECLEARIAVNYILDLLQKAAVEKFKGGENQIA